MLGDTEIARVYHVLEAHPYRGAIELDTQKLFINEWMNIIEQSFEQN